VEIKEALTRFHTSLVYNQLSPHTLRAYENDLVQWQQMIKKDRLEEIHFIDLQDYLGQLQQLNLQINSLRRKRVVVHRFLKFCYEKRLTTEPMHQWLDPIRAKKNTKPKEILTVEELKKLQLFVNEQMTSLKKESFSEHSLYLYYCSIRNKLLLNLLIYTGARANEVVSLEKKHIDPTYEQLVILAKGYKYNAVPIHPTLKQAFIDYEEKISFFQQTSLGPWLEESLYFFPSRLEATHLSTRTLQDIMRTWSNVLGRKIHAHLFRHTFASYCIASNMDIATVSALISHSNPSITLSIYTHEIESSQKKKEMEKLNFD
jgi:site-specific recombinase XerD